MTRSVKVELGARSYEVRIGQGLLGELGSACAALGRVRQVIVVSDSTVAPLYGKPATQSVQASGLAAALLTFPAGEPSKTLATYGRVMNDLLRTKPAIDRDAVVVAIGGGVVGDLAGFVAATALRGLRFIQCPTTLLAAVDSSVGGKTGLDHAVGKNLIGAFHQPRTVLVDVDALASLPVAEIRNGLAECVKHGVIRDASLLDYIEASADAIFAHNPDVMIELIARNVAIKAAVVSADEREAGGRAYLNFGHTFAHAIETSAGYDAIRHGEAVSLGMVAACRLAATRGLISASDAARVERLLAKLGLPTRRDGLDPAKLWELMQHDKKNRAGRVRLVLPTRLGEVETFDDATEREVRDAGGTLTR